MDFRKLITRYKQFGGFQLALEYAKLGALWPAIKTGLQCLVKKQSFKLIYPTVLRRIEPFLMEKYASVVSSPKYRVSSKEANADCTNQVVRPVWFCWLQGLDAAPPIVKACYRSLNRNLVQEKQGYEIKVIDNKNWREYVELPEYIVKKWEKGKIQAAMFSDLLRLELLIKYGERG